MVAHAIEHEEDDAAAISFRWNKRLGTPGINAAQHHDQQPRNKGYRFDLAQEGEQL